MHKRINTIIVLAFGLAIIFTLMFFDANIVAGQTGALTDIEEKLAGLSDKERVVLQHLFALSQEIAEMEKEERRLGLDAEIVMDEIRELEKIIAAEQISYETKRDVLKQVLRSYQRMGPSSYLEIILDSGSLAAFLRRLNTLRDLTRNTGELLHSLQESGEKLAAEKNKVAEKLPLLAEKQELLKTALAKSLRLKEENEEYLASLAEEREYYHGQLTVMQQAWEELKNFFPQVTKEFSRIIEEEALPQEALKTTITLSGIKASIDEQSLNEIISGHGLTDMVLRFYPGRVEIAVPDKSLVMEGIFILEGETLKFQAQEGSFYGMALQTGSLEELFAEGELLLNLKTLVGNNILRSIEIQAGRLELLIIPVF